MTIYQFFFFIELTIYQLRVADEPVLLNVCNICHVLGIQRSTMVVPSMSAADEQ